MQLHVCSRICCVLFRAPYQPLYLCFLPLITELFFLPPPGEQLPNQMFPAYIPDGTSWLAHSFVHRCDLERVCARLSLQPTGFLLRRCWPARRRLARLHAYRYVRDAVDCADAGGAQPSHAGNPPIAPPRKSAAGTRALGSAPGRLAPSLQLQVPGTTQLLYIPPSKTCGLADSWGAVSG